MTVAERARLAAFPVAKRRADYLLGRLTAKAVVAAAMGEGVGGEWPPRVIELLAGPGGAPYALLAPEAAPQAGFAPGERLPVSVSISHTESSSLCAATYTSLDTPGRVIGVDLGRIEPRSPELQVTFFTEAERVHVSAGSPNEAELRANLVWCAKEAVLKALGLGLTVDTLGLTCLPEDGVPDPSEWLLEPGDGPWRTFEARCEPSLVPGGARIRGVWRTFSGFVGALAQTSAHPDRE